MSELRPDAILHPMTQKVPCRACQVPILPVTAAGNDGLCWPCKRGTRQQLETAKTVRLEESKRWKERQRRRDLLLLELSELSDSQIIARIENLTPLADEDDPVWMNEEYWLKIADAYLAFADISERRRLRPSIPLLLDRACYGDPGEIMRGLRHRLEAIVEPDWAYLADICLDRANSPRKGTRLWSIYQLAILDDSRAKLTFERAVETEPSLISDVANIGLQRLARANSGVELN